MDDQIAIELICENCSSVIAVSDLQCQSCGATVENVSADTQHTVAAPGPLAWRQLVDNRWVVLGLLFLVMAAFVLPLLWSSRAFSQRAKLLLTVVVVTYTALILWLITMILRYIYEQILLFW